jgi:hypothetical protein
MKMKAIAVKKNSKCPKAYPYYSVEDDDSVLDEFTVDAPKGFVNGDHFCLEGN